MRATTAIRTIMAAAAYMLAAATAVCAQAPATTDSVLATSDTVPARSAANVAKADTIITLPDSAKAAAAFLLTTTGKADTVASLEQMQSLGDSLASQAAPVKPVRVRHKPDPQRAMWLALVIPGAGQIYNRKFWKLPIIYGGVIGCTYALTWNQQMYNDYSQAYRDLMDDDPNTCSYKNILPMGYDITGREEQFKQIFKRKKDFYRKNRDLSIFAFFGVYLVSVIDAYVDAHLSNFDITPDLSMHVGPAVIPQRTLTGMPSGAVGIQCNLKF